MKTYQQILREAITNVDDFVLQLDAAIRKIFPKSYIEVRSSSSLGKSISVRFTLGKDKSEWTNGIIQNDVLFSSWMVGWNSFDNEGNFIKDKIEAEISTGGSLKIVPGEGSHMAFDRAKIGWRKKTASPDKIIQHFTNYFKKAKKVLKDNKDKIPPRDMELIGKKI
jgi:hypothetical protein